MEIHRLCSGASPVGFFAVRTDCHIDGINQSDEVAFRDIPHVELLTGVMKRRIIDGFRFQLKKINVSPLSW